MRQHNFLFWNSRAKSANCHSPEVVVSFERGDFKVFFIAWLVANMRWNSEKRVRTFEAYFSNGKSVIATQCAYRRHFNVAPLGRVPDRKLILYWVKSFWNTGNVTRRRNKVPQPVRSRENVEAVRATMLRFPRCSARKHASALGISDRSLWRFLHSNLHLFLYKLAATLIHVKCFLKTSLKT